MPRRSTIGKVGALFVLALLLAGSEAALPDGWLPRYGVVVIFTAYVFLVALAVLVVSAFTRLDWLRLCAAVAVLSSLSALMLLPVPGFLIGTVQLHHQKVQVGTAVSGFVQRHGRVPASVRELYPEGTAPAFARNEPYSLKALEQLHPEGVSPIWEKDFSFPETVVLRDPRLQSSTGLFWRYDTERKVWNTHPDTDAGVWLRTALLEHVSSPAALVVLLVSTVLSVALAYRPWRRLGEQKSSINRIDTDRYRSV